MAEFLENATNFDDGLTKRHMENNRKSKMVDIDDEIETVEFKGLNIRTSKVDAKGHD